MQKPHSRRCPPTSPLPGVRASRVGESRCRRPQVIPAEAAKVANREALGRWPRCRGAVGDDRAEREPRIPRPDRQIRDSDTKNCNRCTAACCALVTGSAPGQRRRRLVPLPRRQQPARYSREPAAAPDVRTGHQTGPHTSQPDPAPQHTAHVRVVTQPRTLSRHSGHTATLAHSQRTTARAHSPTGGRSLRGCVIR